MTSCEGLDGLLDSPACFCQQIEAMQRTAILKIKLHRSGGSTMYHDPFGQILLKFQESNSGVAKFRQCNKLSAIRRIDLCVTLRPRDGQ